MTDLAIFQPCERPGQKQLKGRLVRLEPFQVDAHAAALFDCLCATENNIWDYIIFPRPTSVAEMAETFASRADDWQTMVIIGQEDDHVFGSLSYMRIREGMGSVEIGAVLYGPDLQRTTAGTEAMFLAADHPLSELGYRRLEWKCDSNNEASRRAAKRYGFRFEGTFRQDLISHGQNRDTDWFSIIDCEWPERRAEFNRWLSLSNFNDDGEQLTPLQMS